MGGNGWLAEVNGDGRYEGINVLLLGLTAAERDYSSPW
jgi:hypothetical protein